MRRVLVTGGLAAAGLLVYAAVVEPRWLQLTRPTIHVRRLPPELEGLRLALLSDLHVGEFTRPSLVRRAVGRVMAERPDLVAITGDLAADPRSLRETLLELSALRAPLGVYAVPGNHDHVDVGTAVWHDALHGHPGITDLTNRVVTCDVRGTRLCIAGVDDYYEGTPRLDVLPPPEERDLTILLAHSPDQAERSRRRYDAVDLMVSGHTHGGQVQLPFLGAPVSSAERPDLYLEGLRRRPWTQVYTSRGVGTTGVPFRFLSRPEVPILRLTAAPRPPLGTSPVGRS